MCVCGVSDCKDHCVLCGYVEGQFDLNDELKKTIAFARKIAEDELTPEEEAFLDDQIAKRDIEEWKRNVEQCHHNNGKVDDEGFVTYICGCMSHVEPSSRVIAARLSLTNEINKRIYL